ncbi:MAG: ROK family protein [Selenomonadaceae bacterium]|nr:ROK family protein [Selenomonadaceae bacterium]
MRKILTIDVGGTFIKHAVMTGTRSFKITNQNKIPTPKENHEKFLKTLADIFKANDDVEGIGVSMPGLIDNKRGVCISSGALNFSNGHCLTEELQDICGVPVAVENDANCAALAEVKSGSLKDVKDAVVLVFGTGVGGALIHNKKIYRGTHFCAGEVSFVLKNINGTAAEENFYADEFSALAFQKSCAKILNMPEEQVTGEMIFDLIEENNDDMLDALYKFAHGVAALILNLQVILDPERFALGGGISERQSFIDAVHSKIDELCANAPDFLPRPEVVACKYRNDANLFGALYNYLKK